MKKLLISVFALVLALSFSSVSFAAVDSRYEVAIAKMEGDVKVDTKGDGNWITPWKGMKLKKESLIKTGKGSYCDIVFDAEGLNLVRIKPNTEITVEKAQVFMPDGEVLVKFANLAPGSSFIVKTPSAACGIRGSGMGVGYDKDTGQTNVQAFEHNAFVQPLDPQTGQPKGGEKTLGEGNKIDVTGDGQLGQEQQLTEGEQESFNDFVQDAGLPGGDEDAEAGEGGEGEEEEQEDADEVEQEVEEMDAETDIDVKDLDEEKEISPSS
ncbi:MAG: hypothetical protein GF392_06510 [Candidatus Omnitrophica bacterium]|nr:hypothetical protein [Candidatus Omnitrophota bacterium]